MISKDDRIFVAGHRGLAGSAIVRALRGKGYENIVMRTRAELDLRNQPAVRDFYQAQRPNVVIMAAGKVGGIGANHAYPADFIMDNLLMESLVVSEAYAAGVRNLLLLGSSCAYPKHCAQPIREVDLLSGHLEPTNAPYAVAKIAGITMCEAYNRQHGTKYRAVMPTNLYGPGDTFHLEKSHVLPAIMLRMHLAKEARLPEVSLWGTGKPLREFLHVDDLADACVFLLERTEGTELVNIGSGTDVSISALAGVVAGVVGYEGRILFDSSKPDGTPRKLLDTTRIRTLGWKPRIRLEEGLKETYAWFLEHHPLPTLAQ